jgi:hypothetical protein
LLLTISGNPPTAEDVFQALAEQLPEGRYEGRTMDGRECSIYSQITSKKINVSGIDQGYHFGVDRGSTESRYTRAAFSFIPEFTKILNFKLSPNRLFIEVQRPGGGPGWGPKKMSLKLQTRRGATLLTITEGVGLLNLAKTVLKCRLSP